MHRVDIGELTVHSHNSFIPSDLGTEVSDAIVGHINRPCGEHLVTKGTYTNSAAVT